MVAVDIFGNQNLLVPHWEGLVRSYLMERPDPKGHPSASRVMHIIRRLAQAPVMATHGVGEGIELHLNHPRLAGHALMLSDAVVHVSAFTVSKHQLEEAAGRSDGLGDGDRRVTG